MPKIFFNLHICGKGNDFERLNEIVSRKKFFEKNLRISFRGYVPSTTTYLRNCDFYLLSSKIEGSPLSLIEAACTGINCISTPSSPAILELRKDFPNVHVCNENSLESFSKLFHDIVKKYISSQKLHSFKTPNSFYSLDECMAELLKKF